MNLPINVVMRPNVDQSDLLVLFVHDEDQASPYLDKILRGAASSKNLLENRQILTLLDKTGLLDNLDWPVIY